jgi:acyl transferase domain-containing protein
VVLEEAPARPADDEGESAGEEAPHLIILSARSEAALEVAAAQLARHLGEHPEIHPADLAFTLQAGRKPFEHRRALVCRDLAEATALLRAPDPRRVWGSATEPGHRPVAFLISGQG